MQRNVYTLKDFDFKVAKVGDLVDAEVVWHFMNALPPIRMTRNVIQMSGAVDTRFDAQCGYKRNVYSTFVCREGNYMSGTWKYCGNCFAGETCER